MQVKRFALNTKGRDFVIGDVHGAFNLVIHGMKEVRFNPEVDRLFGVGDLIDRGPDSHRVAQFLQLPYVHMVRGNHDHDFVSLSLPEIRTLAAMNFNGLGWASCLTDQALLAIQFQLAQLPIAIEVQTSRGLVGIVHADVPHGMCWRKFLEKLEADDHAVVHAALWGRDRINQEVHEGVLGVDRLYVGHTIQWGGARRFGNVYAIDTGAVFRELDGSSSGHLSMVNLACQTAMLTVPATNHASLHVVPEAGAGPFGSYAAPTAVAG